MSYMDGRFGILAEGKEKLKEFYGHLNGFHERIKFNMDYSQTEINFLNVNVLINDKSNQLGTTLLSKLMDIHQYLHAISCHRTIYKKLMIPYGQTKKIKRIGSNEDDLQVKLVNFGHRFERIRLFSEVRKSFVTEKKSGLH